MDKRDEKTDVEWSLKKVAEKIVKMSPADAFIFGFEVARSQHKNDPWLDDDMEAAAEKHASRYEVPYSAGKELWDLADISQTVAKRAYIAGFSDAKSQEVKNER